MDTTATEIAIAAIGFGGVIVGALTTGGVEMYVADAGRRRQTRVAARLLLIPFIDLQREMKLTAATTSLPKCQRLDWTPLIGVWAVTREKPLSIRTRALVKVDFVIDLMKFYGEKWNALVDQIPTDPRTAAALLEPLTASIGEFLDAEVEETLSVIFAMCLTRRERIGERIQRWMGRRRRPIRGANAAELAQSADRA
jgi:hypothetical protein